MHDHDDGRPTDERAGLSRRGFVGVSMAAVVGAGLPAVRPGTRRARDAGREPFALAEATVDQLQDAMRGGRLTARVIAEHYLARIDALDRRGPTLNHVIELNPDALAIADALDAARKAGQVRGPLHGIPVLVKDNIDTADRMHTSAGSLALATSIAPRDACVTERLRAAGALILGKTSLSEWANFRSTHASSAWCARGGQGKNPYALERNTSGSSSGSAGAAAANYATLAVGTETDGSVTSPAAACCLVGIKPTVGLVGRSGIIPISHSQDTAGPMSRTVRDAALLLGALTGVDPRDEATRASAGRSHADYTRFLDANGLRGARLGVARKRYTGYSPKTDAVFAQALDALREAGATIVDPADIATAGQFDDAELEVLLYEFKHDLNAYLATLGPDAPVRSLADCIAFNARHAAEEMPWFGQELFEMAQRKGPLTDRKYRAARATCVRLARARGIDAALATHRLDALIAPTQGPAWLVDLVNGDAAGASFTSPAAVAGYPHVTVPMGFVQGLPVGLSFVGAAWSEPTLLRLAYAFEQATRVRKAPSL